MEEKTNDKRQDRRPHRSGGRQGGRPDRRNNGRHHQRHERNPKIDGLIRRIREELAESIEPITIPDLNAFERKLIHRQFDNNSQIVTKTYRLGEEAYELRVYPVGNLKRYAQQMAEEAMAKREKVVLPHMSSYERFIVHDYLKTLDTVKSTSVGEDEDRHIEIEAEMFGRGLKRFIRKIKLF